jgi:hypothetical protein
MADKDITIGVRTTGTQESSKAIHQVGGAMNDLQSSQRDAVRSFEQQADKARVAEFAFYDLNNEIAKTKGTTETYTAGSTRMEKSTRNNSAALLMFSQGLEDAQYGVRGVLNNIPGLVMALGGTAGLAGAISIAAVGLAQLDGLFTSSATKAKDLKEKIGEIAANAATLETERFEKLATGIDTAADAAAALRQNFNETETASANLAAAGVDHAAKMATAQRNIADALGAQVDAYQELEAAETRAQQKRELAAQQQIAAEQRRREEAQLQVAIAEEIVAQQKALAESEQANLLAIRADLAAARKERDALTKAARGAKAFDGVNPFVPGGDVGFLPPKIGDFRRAKEAEKKLADPALTATISALESRADALDAALLALTKDGGIVQKAEIAFVEAQKKLTDITASVGINIGRIEQTLAEDDLVARSEGLIASQQQQATTLSEALGKIETTNAAAEQAKASISAIVADGQVTAAESDQLARASVQLIGQIQAGLATAGTNTQEIIQIISQVATQNAANRQQIEQLQKQVQALQR